jgi:thiopurine S-methyltransferase
MNTGRDNKLWLQSWRDKNTDFHQVVVNPLLARYWPLLELPNRCRIFVPLCGKSLDILWLAEQGHRVIGVELSPIAVKAFFEENGLTPTVHSKGKFSSWSHGNITILCGDYFALTKHELGNVNTVYDRAALTALDEDVRKSYVEHLRKIVPKNTSIFLLTTEDAVGDIGGVDSEIESLYTTRFKIELIHSERVPSLAVAPRGICDPAAEFRLYQLSAR